MRVIEAASAPRPSDEPSSVARLPAERVTRWSVATLGSGLAALEPAYGFALIWPKDAIEIAHAGRETSLRAGDLTIIDRSIPLGITGTTGWTAALLELGDRRIGARVDDRHRFVAAALDGSTDLAQVVKRLWLMLQDMGELQLRRANPGDDLVEARMIEILTDLAGRLAAQIVDARLTSRDATTLERAQVLIAAHLAKPSFGVSELAALMRVSPRHLSSLFARIDTTTSQAILDARIELARRLLLDPVNARRQISSIALACGFDDQSYFARCFRRAVGTTPRRFRADSHK